MDEKVYEKLTRYCSYQERCEQDVLKKIQQLKAEAESRLLIQLLKGDNYLNEERFVKAFVNGNVRKKWGKARIKSALLRKRISAELIQKHLSDIDEDNYMERLKKAAEQKWKRIKAENEHERKMKLYAFLLAKGYESKDISKVYQQLKT